MPEDFQGTREGAPGAVARHLGFRFVLSYFLLYNLELVLRWILGARGLRATWTAIVRWAGRHVLHLGREISAVPTGSGDRTFDYVQVLCMLVLAALAALVWLLVDRRPDRRQRLLREGLRIYLRYAAALLLLSYGMSKVIKVEFPFPGIERLEERIGDSSPLTLYSVFMGYSTPYTFFIGSSAVLAGMLLFFRRTTTLGALLSLAVIVNEGMLAFCYDVPTKLLSTHLLLMTLFLLAPEARRLVDGILLDRPTRPANLAPPFTGPFFDRRFRLALKTLIVGYALFSTAKQNLDLERERRLTLETQELQKGDRSKYLLVTRGIHVIDDEPMNR
jgi:hypothetical protein